MASDKSQQHNAQQRSLWCRHLHRLVRACIYADGLQVLLSEDVQGAANKLIILKTMFPTADVFSIMATRPKTLLQSEQRIEENAKQVGTDASVLQLEVSGTTCLAL